ncbi:MAG: hypothetical protein IJ190_01090 [Prevotella sp.]|nr:hypothetical protein [Prevotella sp.]
MKRSVFTIALLIALQVSQIAVAQNEKVTLHVQNSVRPLVEKWVAEYSKTNDNVTFQIVAGKAQDNQNSISFVTEQANDAVFFARYAVLPVVNKSSEAEQLLGSKRLNAKKLKSLFFVKDEFEDDTKESKAEKSLHIYTGNSQQSASRAYAASFKQETSNYKGKKISGDDSFLNVALSRDPLGVAINSLSNIFDLQSRQLRNNLALVPLDIDKHGEQVLDEARLDDIILLLEQQQFAEIPVGKLGLQYNCQNSQLNAFVRWILTDGNKYIHEYGLLQLPQKELASQLHRTEQKELAQK